MAVVKYPCDPASSSLACYGGLSQDTPTGARSDIAEGR